MRSLLLTLALCLACAVPMQAQPAVRLTPPSAATLPAACAIGDLVTKTGEDAGLYVCTATDTWTLVGSGGSTFDQSLNTTDSPTFNALTVTSCDGCGGSVDVPGDDTQVLFNDGGALGASDLLTYSETGGLLVGASIPSIDANLFGQYDPVLAADGAGAVANGSYRYKFTLTDGIHETDGNGAPTTAVTVTDNTTNGKIRVTVPITPEAFSSSYTSVKIYRDFNADGAFKLVDIFDYSSGNVFIDNVANEDRGNDIPVTSTALATMALRGNRFEPFYNPDTQQSLLLLGRPEQGGLTIRAAQGDFTIGGAIGAVGGAFSGGILVLTGGDAVGPGDRDGGTVYINGGSPSGTGERGKVSESGYEWLWNTDRVVMEQDGTTLFAAPVTAPNFIVSGAGAITVNSQAGVTVSGTSCTITAITGGIITGASCTP
jgi:hypothetical protein